MYDHHNDYGFAEKDHVRWPVPWWKFGQGQFQPYSADGR